MDQGTLHESDKGFWHGYVDFYAPFLERLSAPRRILEFGVFRGHSIRWLWNKFPTAKIKGVDIVPEAPEWPKDCRIDYVRLDQGDRAALQTLFSDGTAYDLIIEDGSHLPVHQALCLVHGMRHVRPGGLYILEDIHTSHPSHSLYRALTMQTGGAVISALHLLLAFQHLKHSGNASPETLKGLSKNSLFSEQDVAQLFTAIDKIHVYKRATLPKRCWKCGGDAFDYASLHCRCGEPLYAAEDSMTIVLEKTL